MAREKDFEGTALDTAVEETCEIELTKGFVAIVDKADFELLARWKWHASKSKKSWGQIPKWYASRFEVIGRRGRTKSGKIRYRKKKIYMHRFLMNCDDPALYVDHIDGNTMNYRRSNLRIVTPQGNAQNRKNSVDRSDEWN